jgi:phosphate-selective porin OprO/OprP
MARIAKTPNLIARAATLAAIGIVAVAPALADPPAEEAPKPAKPEIVPTWNIGAPKFTFGDMTFKPSGRIQFDVFSLKTDGLSTIDSDYARAFVRRAYLGAEGQFNDSWRYKVNMAFQPGADPATSSVTTLRLCQDAGSAIVQRTACLSGETDRGPVVTSVSTSGGDGDVGFDDVFLQYVAGPWEFTIGQNAIASTMEDRTTTLSIPFNERSPMVNAFGSGKAMGITAAASGENWAGAVGIYGDDLSNPESLNTSETIALQARGSWAPIMTDDTVVHLGVNVRMRDNAGGPDGSAIRGPGYRYRARPNTGWGERFVDTGSNTYAQDAFYGAEFAAQHQAISLSGEYGMLKARPQSGSPLVGFEPTFAGGYLDLFWSPTGDTRSYKVKDGLFGRLSTNDALGANGIGAIAIGARYEYLDLTDGIVDGGMQSGFTLQGTWQPVNFLKFQLDYSRLDIDRPSSPLSGTADVITMRSQIEW